MVATMPKAWDDAHHSLDVVEIGKYWYFGSAYNRLKSVGNEALLRMEECDRHPQRTIPQTGIRIGLILLLVAKQLGWHAFSRWQITSRHSNMHGKGDIYNTYGKVLLLCMANEQLWSFGCFFIHEFSHIPHMFSHIVMRGCTKYLWWH